MDISVLKKKYELNDAKEEVSKLEALMANGHNSGQDMSALSIDLAYYAGLSTNISKFQKAIQDYDDALEMSEADSDPDLKDLALEEVSSLEKEIESLDKEITKMKVDRMFQDVDDNKSAILEIRAGAGGDEAALFAADLYNMYKTSAINNGWVVSVISSNVTEGGGYKEVVAHIEGKNVFKHLKYESGVHRVQRVPVTESSGRIHTSTASVAILPEAKDIDIEIKPEDITVEVMRASGAGGQCVNRTDSAVRITHNESGIVVSCQETKHQAQNKEKAMAMLRARLYDKKRAEEQAKRSDMRSSQIGTSMRAEKIRTYNYPQNRVTDHRIKKSWYALEEIVGGKIEEMLNDVREGIQLQMIEESGE
jgi:peptide chain release factor 1